MTRKRPDRPYVFCIGWHKTGTSSLGDALLELGYSVLGCRLDMVHPLRRGELDSVLALASQFDAVQDVPWAPLFRELDAAYPGSKFILTKRDETSWLKSARRHFKDTFIPLHEWIYGEGVLEGNEDLYIKRFRQHYRDVNSHFSNRPGDLLVVNLAEGSGWSEICSFLGHEIPTAAFPHSNKAPENYNLLERFRAQVRAAAPVPARKALFTCRLAFRSLLGLPDPRNKFNNFPQNRDEIARAKKSR